MYGAMEVFNLPVADMGARKFDVFIAARLAGNKEIQEENVVGRPGIIIGEFTD